jgi:hypothetical protein
MIYSVWNPSLGAFDYFEGAHEQSQLNAEKPQHLVSRTLGATVEQAAWPAPGNLRQIGSGTEAIGRIATRRIGALGDSVIGELSLVKAGLLAISGYLAWKYVVKSRRSRA